MNTSSIIPLSTQGGHSAQVNMRLLVNGFSLVVSQMGPDFVLVESPLDHPPASASIVLQVDQHEQIWKVRLPAGISSNKNRIEIAADL